jgi:subtilisin family serine protease
LPREIVALRLTPAQLTALEARGFVLLARSAGPLAVGDLFRFEVPSTVSTAAALRLARDLAPSAIIDFNHIYRPAQAECRDLFCQQRRTIRWPQPPNECRVEASIGLIDTTVDRSVPALAGQKVTILDGVSGGRPLASMNHGTAIAALLIGRSDASVPGLLPRSEVVTVQAFHKSDAGEDIGDTFDIVTAVDTLLKRGLKVINLSFTGPNNRLLAEIVARSASEQTLLVAAAGNRGPTAPVVYPAGYESVVAVTAVGDDLRIYRGANRGNFVDFAAPGVNVQVVSAKVETRFETGTSFAAPFITAALAASHAQQPAASPDALVTALQSSATDLGKPGRDPVFGWGLVQVPEICP